MSTGGKSRVAMVTGAGGGLGRCHALALAAAGARVVVSDISGPAASAVAAEISAAGGAALGLACDVTDPASVQAMVDRAVAQFGGIDILVNNAGILRDRSFAKSTADEFQQVLNVHVMGSYHVTRAVWPLMQAAGYGRIVLTASASGIYGNFGQSNYAAAKSAMIGLMNTLHIEGARHCIRVNALVPVANTAMTKGLISPEEAALLDPADVSPAVVFLTGEDAPSRVIMGAGAGAFSVIHITESQGLWLPPGGRSAADIARNYARISDPARLETPEAAFDQSRKFIRLAGGGEVG